MEIEINLENLSIEPITKEEIPLVLELYAQPEFDNGKMLPLDKAIELYNKILTYPEYKIYLAKLGAEAVGTFSLIIMDNLLHLGQPSALVEALIVHEKYRSMGIGRKMMEFAMAKCREAGCSKLCLSSRSERKRTHSFYESLGFQKHGYSFFIDFK